MIVVLIAGFTFTLMALWLILITVDDIRTYLVLDSGFGEEDDWPEKIKPRKTRSDKGKKRK